MILNGSQRGGARDLAVHLMKPENEHVEVHEIRGFVSGTLAGALREAEAVSRGTKCRRHLYSLSLSPPETERATIELFGSAIDRVEAKLGWRGILGSSSSTRSRAGVMPTASGLGFTRRR